MTRQAVVAFQAGHGLSPDAIIGPMTGGALEQQKPGGAIPPTPGLPPVPGGAVPTTPGLPPVPGGGAPTPGLPPVPGGAVPPTPGLPPVPGGGAPRPGQPGQPGQPKTPGVPGPHKFEDKSKINPRVDYDSESKGRNIEGEVLPFLSDKSQWRGHDILSVLTQVDRIEETETDMFRCAANSTMAIAIMRGPGQVINYAMRISWFAEAMSSNPEISAERKALCKKVMTFADGLRSRLQNGTATFADLSRMADYTKQLTSNPTGKTNSAEILAMQQGSGVFTQIVNTKVTERAKFNHVLDHILKPGDAMTVGVDINKWDGKTKLNVEDADHMIVIGKDKEGRVYMYDPLPRKGSQLKFRSDPQFASLFEGDQVEPGQDPPFKPVFLVGVTTERVPGIQ